jgi:hypothetical protein
VRIIPSQSIQLKGEWPNVAAGALFEVALFTQRDDETFLLLRLTNHKIILHSITLISILEENLSIFIFLLLIFV